MTESNCGRARSMCVALFALVCGLEGCVLQGGSVPISSADDESATGDSAQGLSAYTAEYTWERKRPSRRMVSSAGNVCFLTGIHGRFKGSSEMVMISNVRGYWYVTGRSNQPGTGATARCFKYDSAKVIATRINQSISGKELDLGAHGFCALSRVSGSFESDADLVRVYRADSGHWFLQSTATSSGVNAGALCLDDDPKTPLRTSRITDVATGDIQVLAENLVPNETKPTEPLKGPACFLTGMAGKFSGEGGNVQTFVSASAKGTWNYYLRATSADAAPRVSSSGACLR